MIPILTALISPITNLLSKRSDNKTAVKKKQLDRVMNADDQLAEWESIQAESGKHSWKDEFWTVILAIPAVMCFFPDYVGDVKAGFAALKTMPDFYQYWLGVAILTAFGIRIAKR
jgi:hypothetical protein